MNFFLFLHKVHAEAFYKCGWVGLTYKGVYLTLCFGLIESRKFKNHCQNIATMNAPGCDLWITISSS